MTDALSLVITGWLGIGKTVSCTLSSSPNAVNERDYQIKSWKKRFVIATEPFYGPLKALRNSFNSSRKRYYCCEREKQQKNEEPIHLLNPPARYVPANYNTVLTCINRLVIRVPGTGRDDARPVLSANRWLDLAEHRGGQVCLVVCRQEWVSLCQIRITLG